MKKLLFLMFFILISALSVYSQETYPNAKKHMDVYVNGTLALPSFDGYFYYMQGCPNIFDTKEHINNPNIHYPFEKPAYHFFKTPDVHKNNKSYDPLNWHYQFWNWNPSKHT